MNRCLVFVIVSSLSAFVGCVQEDSACDCDNAHEGGVLVVGVEKSDASCDLKGSADGPFLARGVMDIALTNRFFMSSVLVNQGDTLMLEGASISFTTNVPQLQQVFSAELFTPFGGTVFADESASMPVEIISEALGRQMEGTQLFAARGTLVTILVNVVFKGTTTSGIEVESNSFSYPVDICSGCLLNYPSGTLFEDDDGSQTCDVSKDPNAVAMPMPTIAPEQICIYGQDEFVDCRLCRSAVGDPVVADIICDP